MQLEFFSVVFQVRKVGINESWNRLEYFHTNQRKKCSNGELKMCRQVASMTILASNCAQPGSVEFDVSSHTFRSTHDTRLARIYLIKQLATDDMTHCKKLCSVEEESKNQKHTQRTKFQKWHNVFITSQKLVLIAKIVTVLVFFFFISFGFGFDCSAREERKIRICGEFSVRTWERHRYDCYLIFEYERIDEQTKERKEKNIWRDSRPIAFLINFGATDEFLAET